LGVSLGVEGVRPQGVLDLRGVGKAVLHLHRWLEGIDRLPAGTVTPVPVGTWRTRMHVSSALQSGQGGLLPVDSQSLLLEHGIENVCEQWDCVRQNSPGTQAPQLLQSAFDVHGWLVVCEQCCRSNCVVWVSLTPPTLSDSMQLRTFAPWSRKLHGGRLPSRRLAFFRRIVRSTVLVFAFAGSYVLRFGFAITWSLGLGAQVPTRTAMLSQRELPST